MVEPRLKGEFDAPITATERGLKNLSIDAPPRLFS